MFKKIPIRYLTLLSALGLSASVRAQDIGASIKFATDAITFDGANDEAAWAEANELTDFNVAGGAEPDDDADISAKWRGLWDENNFYFYIDVADSMLFTEDTNEWKDDSVEIYLDGGALGKGDDPVTDYRPEGDFFGPGIHPIYQLTIIAGQDQIYNGTNHRRWVELHPGTELDEDMKAIHLGSTVKSDTGYTLEIAIPWESTGSSLIDVLSRGFMGWGIAINDNDVGGDRETQLMWNTTLGDLWNNPTQFPNVELTLPENLPGPQILVGKTIDLGQLSLVEPTFTGTINLMNLASDKDLTISGVTASGQDAGAITFGDMPASLAPGELGEITYILTPTRTGEFLFNIDIASDDLEEADRMKSVAITAAIINGAGPTAHFAFDEDAGSTEMRDISGQGNHGVYDGVTLGQEALATGTSGAFDGSGVGTWESEFAPEDFTVSMWVNASAFSDTQLLIGQGSPEFGLVLTNGSPAWFSSAGVEFTGASALATGATHHIAASYTSGDSPTVTLYVDGAMALMEADATEVGLTADTWHIGSFNGQLGFSGRIDDVQIYDRTLTAEEVQGLFDTPGAGGIPGSLDSGGDVSGLADVTSAGDAIVLVDGTNDDDGDAGPPPANEGVENAIDDSVAKYLNFLDLGSGFIVTPSSSLTTVSALRLYTANDESARDPASYRLEGSTGDAEGPFVVISEGLLNLPDDRNEDGPLDPETSANQVVVFENTTPYSAYRVTFPALKDAGANNSMQIAEVELLGTVFEIPAPVVHYNFNEGSGTAVGNGGSGDAGELVNAHEGAWVASGGLGDSAYLNFTQDGATTAESQHITTGLAADAIPVSGEVDYTMMAWARYDEKEATGVNNDDRMIFGQLDGNVLHNGVRGTQFYMGHWGDGNDTGGGVLEIGVWQHLTWRYQGGTQAVLVNGVEVISGEGGGLAELGDLIIGGTRGDQDRDFSGDLDDVRIYAAALPDGVIQSIAEGDGQSIPGSGGPATDPRVDLGAVAVSTGPLTEPTLVDFGELSGDATYEFSFNAIKAIASTAIAGNDTWGLKLEQWQDTGFIGSTEFGVVDNVSEAPSIFDADTHVVFVSDTAAGETLIYVNGTFAGSTPGNPAISGMGAVMGARDGTTDPMGEGSVMYGWATYNSALSADDVAVLATAPFPTEGGMPPGGGGDRFTTLGDVGFNADGAFGTTLPDGVTADIEYSIDLISWEVIAPGVTGSVTETDAGRIAAPEGYYRAKQP